MLKINFGVNRLGSVPSNTVLEDGRDFKRILKNNKIRISWNRNVIRVDVGII